MFGFGIFEVGFDKVYGCLYASSQVYPNITEAERSSRCVNVDIVDCHSDLLCVHRIGLGPFSWSTDKEIWSKPHHTVIECIEEALKVNTGSLARLYVV